MTEETGCLVVVRHGGDDLYVCRRVRVQRTETIGDLDDLPQTAHFRREAE